MFTIYGNRKSFYQWDLNQKLIVNSPICSEVHFSNVLSKEALVCVAYKLDGLTVVDVPNILLTEALDIKAYIVAEDGQGCRTCNTGTFEVVKRDKPADYVYTETEVKRYEDFEERIATLEAQEIPTKVSQLENDADYATKTYASCVAEDIAQDKAQLCVYNHMQNVAHVGKTTEQGGLIFNNYTTNAATASNATTFGTSNTASGTQAFVVGANNKVTHDNGCIGSGSYNTVSGNNGFATGYGNKIYGHCSYAEGNGNTIGDVDILDNRKAGAISHVEGRDNRIIAGNYVHVEGRGNVGNREYQHVQGSYNDYANISNDIIHVVGNGTSDTKRSNAHTLDNKGNAWYKKGVFVGGTSQADAKEIKPYGNTVVYTSKEGVIYLEPNKSYIFKNNSEKITLTVFDEYVLNDVLEIDNVYALEKNMLTITLGNLYDKIFDDNGRNYYGVNGLVIGANAGLFTDAETRHIVTGYEKGYHPKGSEYNRRAKVSFPANTLISITGCIN